MSCFYLGETLRNSAVSRAFGISRLCGKPLSPRRRVKSTPETVPFVSHASPICTVCVFAVSDEVLSVFVISSPTRSAAGMKIRRKSQIAVAECAGRAAELHFQAANGCRGCELKLSFGERSLIVLCLILALAVYDIQIGCERSRDIRRLIFAVFQRCVFASEERQNKQQA